MVKWVSVESLSTEEGTWVPWSPWSYCSTNTRCGGVYGSRTRTRTHTGTHRPCSGSSSETGQCRGDMIMWMLVMCYSHPSSLNVPTFIGLNHTDSSGTITSPGWAGGSYLHNQDCLDIISAPGKNITVTFQTFILEDCQCDFVTGITKSNELSLKFLSALELRFCLAPASLMRNKISAQRCFLLCGFSARLSAWLYLS